MYRLSLATFVFIVGCLSMAFLSVPAFAGGAGGSWDCPYGSDPVTGECMGSGGSTGGGGAGGSWGEVCSYNVKLDSGISFKGYSPNPCSVLVGKRLPNGIISVATFSGGTCLISIPNAFSNVAHYPPTKISCEDATSPPTDKPWLPSPDFPPVPEINPDGSPCDPCKQLNDINRKLNVIKNQDITNINNVLYDLSQTITNINNSFTDLSVNQQITNNHLTTIDNSIGDIITNIENNNITQQQIKNDITNVYETMNDYSLQLGDIKLAMGDIDLSLKNTNKLVLDLGLDLDFIKNKLVNDDSKDYTPYLNDIISLLAPCVPTPEIPCPASDTYDDTELIALLTEIQDFMQADFDPGIDDNTVAVTDLTDVELDRNLIKFGVAQCPPDNEFSTMVNGFSFSGGFKHKPLCDFFTLLAPFIKAFGGFSAALILGGGLRR